MSSQDADALARAALHLFAGKYFQIASFAMLVYDHMITFSDEVERIWKQPFTGASLLFYLNRYGNLLEFIVILNAFFDPTWPKDVCHRFAKFEGAGTTILVGICQLVMILRVYALYGRSSWILAFLLALLAGEVAIAAVGIDKGFPIDLPPPLGGCILTGTHPAFAAQWVAPSVTDSIIFFLTIRRSMKLWKQSGKSRVMHVLVRDGIFYFFIIFLTNLMNTIIYFQVEEDLKAIGASFIQLITSVMISRLILNLRGVHLDQLPTQSTNRIEVYYRPGIRIPAFKDDRMTFIIGSLGGEFRTPDDDR
ncbi:unnamed protein product [Cyclocybe aegerita]|uniref:DUF6533 domain-containing protein n=1 Tax=Cyclocybe aegerita TaxID=1973307 RepID=A0A8S0X7B6_CYCAE|nr:unnamed protein product [Cyclocybe aegerita]